MNEKTKSNASAYCNYNEAFTVYDQLRQPNGLQELLQIFGQSDVPLTEQKVLEGGFGTGAYLDAIRHHVGEAHGVEGSSEGLEQAALKMKTAANVHLQVGNILDLSHSDECFHVVMVNQVLHHLDTEPGYPNLDVFLREALRVLKPGGVLTLNTCSREQLDPHSGAYWFYAYIENAARAMQERFVPIEALIARLAALQFTEIKSTLPSGTLFQERYYHDPRLALEPNFQQGDSVYCFLSQENIKAANDRIRAGIEDGSVNETMKRTARRTAEIGEAVIISARKPI